MKKNFFLLLSILSLNISAQKIFLNSGEIITQKNIENIKDFNTWENVKFENYNYCIIQFSQSISKTEREKITTQTGIHFMDYIPRWAFIVAVPSNINTANLTNFNIATILPYLPSYKMANQLIDRPLPYWIQREDGKIEVLIYTFETIPQKTIETQLQKNNYQLVEWQDNTTAKIIITEKQLENITQNTWIKYVLATDAPAQLENTEGRSDHRVNFIDAAYATGTHYDGTGVSVAIGDDGAIGPHIDFKGRVFHHPANMGIGGTHCDHVAGIVGGAGNFDPKGKGNGKGADLHIYEDYDNLTNVPTHYNTQGVRITSNSLGQGCNDGYNNSAKNSDNLINSKFSLMSVHSSGNSGATQCGGVAQGYYTITGGFKSGKNVLAVGNVEKDDKIASSSSRGPSKDGRIKPDICAVGTDVFSTQPNNTYDNFTGTSMACPGVAGTLADLWQAYRDLNAGADPNSALMKALVMNTADDLGNPGPDYIFGYGRINARRAADVLKKHQYIIDSVDNGNTKTFNLNIPSNVHQLKLMLYWNDRTGTPGNSIVLVNDLDLELKSPNATTYKPWVLNNAPNVPALSANAVRFRDSLNNMEQVTLDTVPMGTYTISVKGYDIPQGPQTFVLVYEYLSDSLTMTYPAGGENFVPNKKERIRWDAYNNNLGTFTLEYSSDNAATWNVLSNNIAANRRYYDWTPPNIISGQMLMRISRGAIQDVSDTLFSVIGVPTGLTIDTACGSVFHLKWDALAGANKYTIYQLGAKYMDKIGTSTTNDFYIYNGVNMTDTFYFAVAAMDTISGAMGRRCIAYRKLPGESNCLDDLYNLRTDLPLDKVYSCASSGNVPIKITVRNVGFRNVTNLPVSYQVNALTPVTEFIPGALNIGDSITYTFSSTVNMLNPGTYIVKTWVASNADVNRLNDTTSATSIIYAPVIVTTPYTQDFETPIFPPNGWIVYDYDNNVKWQKTLCLAGAYGGNTYAAYMDFFNYNAKNQIDDLETAMFDLTNVTADSVILSFDIAYAYKQFEEDTLSLWISPICNNNYVPLNYKKWGASLATVGIQNNIFTPTLASQWRNDEVNLTGYKGQKVFVRFRAGNGHGNNLYIDNINLKTKNAVPLTINEQNRIGNINIYPNPSDGKYTLNIESNQTKNIELKIQNIAGQIVLNQVFKLTKGINTTEIDLSKFSSGVYLLELNDGESFQKIKLTKY